MCCFTSDSISMIAAKHRLHRPPISKQHTALNHNPTPYRTQLSKLQPALTRLASQKVNKRKNKWLMRVQKTRTVYSQNHEKREFHRDGVTTQLTDNKRSAEIRMLNYPLHSAKRR